MCSLQVKQDLYVIFGAGVYRLWYKGRNFIATYLDKHYFTVNVQALVVFPRLKRYEKSVGTVGS